MTQIDQVRRIIVVLPIHSWNLAGRPRPNSASGLQLEAGETVLLLWEAPDNEVDRALAGLAHAIIVADAWNSCRRFNSFVTLSTTNPVVERRISSYQAADQVETALNALYGESDVSAERAIAFSRGAVSRTLNS